MSFVSRLKPAVLDQDKELVLRTSDNEGYEPLVTGSEKILVLGAAGQVGGYVTPDITKLYGDKVILTDHPSNPKVKDSNKFTGLDAGNFDELEKFIVENNVKVVINFAAFLSARAQQEPELAQKINVGLNEKLLEIAERQNLRLVYTPSSIAAVNEQQDTYIAKIDSDIDPQSVYGKNKKTLEQLFESSKTVDARALRYAGVLTCNVPPSPGTTEEFDKMIVAAAEWQASVNLAKKFSDDPKNFVTQQKFESYKLKFSDEGLYYPEIPEDAVFPMASAPVVARETLRFLHTPKDQLKTPSRYFLSEGSWDTKDVVAIVKTLSPEFDIRFDESKFNPNKVAFSKEWAQNVAGYSSTDWGFQYDYDSSNYHEGIKAQFERLVKHFEGQISKEVLGVGIGTKEGDIAKA